MLKRYKDFLLFALFIFTFSFGLSDLETFSASPDDLKSGYEWCGVFEKHYVVERVKRYDREFIKLSGVSKEIRYNFGQREEVLSYLGNLVNEYVCVKYVRFSFLFFNGKRVLFSIKHDGIELIDQDLARSAYEKRIEMMRSTFGLGVISIVLLIGRLIQLTILSFVDLKKSVK